MSPRQDVVEPTPLDSPVPRHPHAEPMVILLVAGAAVLFVASLAAELSGPARSRAHRVLQRAAAFPITLAQIREANLSLKEASWWEAGEDGTVKCGLCPFRCTLSRGDRGPCRVRANIDGTLRCLTYARPCSMAIDPIEKKPLFHVTPGARALSIATVGCNLGCVFCQNWEISQAMPEEEGPFEEVSPERVVAVAKARGCTTIAYTYTEPSVFFEYMLDTARLARAAGIKNLWITCGYIEPGPLEELCDVLDAANVDLKGYDEAFYRTYCKATLPPVLRTLETLKRRGVWVEVTNLVIPGANDDPEMIGRLCSWIARRLGPDVPVHFSRFHGDYLLRDRAATPPGTLLKARAAALEAGLRYVYLGNVRIAGAETTFCPYCGEPLIERRGFDVGAVLVEDGKCRLCGRPIAGLWK